MSVRSMLLRANHEIEIRSTVSKRSPLGGVSPGGADLPHQRLKPVWVQPAHPEVINRYQQRGLVVTHRIFCDVQPQANVNDLVVFRKRPMRIRGIVNDLELDRLWYIDTEETNVT